MLANFRRVDFLGTAPSLERERKIIRRLFAPSIKREIRHFPVAVVQWGQKNLQKKRGALSKLLFWWVYPIAFLPLSLPSPSSLLKLPCFSGRELPFLVSRRRVKWGFLSVLTLRQEVLTSLVYRMVSLDWEHVFIFLEIWVLQLNTCSTTHVRTTQVAFVQFSVSKYRPKRWRDRLDKFRLVHSWKSYPYLP